MVLIVIFALLYLTYHSALEAAHVLMAVPFALTGVWAETFAVSTHRAQTGIRYRGWFEPGMGQNSPYGCQQHGIISAIPLMRAKENHAPAR